MPKVIGFDIAKTAFHVCLLSEEGAPILSRTIYRGEVERFFGEQQPSIVGIESCAGSNHWGRLLTAQGHDVRLISPRYVRAFAMTQKSDARDSQAIAEAASRPSTRWRRPIQRDTQERSTLLVAREQMVAQRTAASNALRSLLFEFGHVESVGRRHLVKNAREAIEGSVFSRDATISLLSLLGALEGISASISTIEQRIAAVCREDQRLRRYREIPGVGPITAMALDHELGDGLAYSSGRAFSSSLGLVPTQRGSGGVVRVGRITKTGGRRLRALLYLASMSAFRAEARSSTFEATWLGALAARRPRRVCFVALANKLARTAWSLARHEASFDARLFNPQRKSDPIVHLTASPRHD